jgi:hypothetical protein
MTHAKIAPGGVCASQMHQRGLLAAWTHNPPVVGSSPTRPTTSELGLFVSWRACGGSGMGGRWPGYGRIPPGLGAVHSVMVMPPGRGGLVRAGCPIWRAGWARLAPLVIAAGERWRNDRNLGCQGRLVPGTR